MTTDNPLICRCRRIFAEDLDRLVGNGYLFFHDIQKDTGMSMYCGSCRETAEALFEKKMRSFHGLTRKAASSSEQKVSARQLSFDFS